MSTERRLLRSIVAMETSTGQAPHLPTLQATLGVSSTEFREVLTRLFRKGYVNTDWQTTDAGRRVATRPLGQVLLRRQPQSRRPEPSSNRKSPRKVFEGSQSRLPTRLADKTLHALRSNRHVEIDSTPASVPSRLVGKQRTPPPLPALDTDEEFEVRECELEELPAEAS